MIEEIKKIEVLKEKIKEIEETKRKAEEQLLATKTEYKNAIIEYKNKSREDYYEGIKKYLGRFIFMMNKNGLVSLGKIIDIDPPKGNKYPKTIMSGISMTMGSFRRTDARFKHLYFTFGNFSVNQEALDKVIDNESNYYRFITEKDYKDIVIGFSLNKNFDPLQILDKSQSEI